MAKFDPGLPDAAGYRYEKLSAGAAGQVYFVRNYRLGEGATLADYIKGRTQPGRTHFTDLIFKQ